MYMNVVRVPLYNFQDNISPNQSPDKHRQTYNSAALHFFVAHNLLAFEFGAKTAK